MPTANTNLRVSELDFDTIKANMKTYLRSQSEFNDYDFEGSAMNILLDVLAYNAHYMGMYANMIANEMFLDTAQLRNSVISHARLLGYTPRSTTGSTAYVDIVVSPPSGNAQGTLTLPSSTPFISEAIDGINYNFVTLESYTANKSSNTFTFSNVAIKEGEPITFLFTQDQNNPKQKFPIPSGTIDTDTLSVVVQVSSSNTSQQVYTLADDLTELGANSYVYFLDETENGSYTIYFGDGTIGRAISNGSIVRVGYLDTNGDQANRANVFTSANPIGGFSNVSVATVTKSAGGAPKESIEDIKFRAPIFYTTQNRAVTKNDYSLLLKRDYPNIDSISIWGGEEYTPPKYGKVFISMKPKDGYVFTTQEKQSIIDDIIATRSVLTVTPEIIDPDYLYLKFAIKVYYDPKKTTRTAEELKSAIRTAILNYRDTTLDSFNSVFRASKLHYLLDKVDKSITSNDFSLFLQKRATIVNGLTQNYTVNFYSPLHRGGLQEHLVSYPTVTVRDNDDIERAIYFEEVQGAYTGVDSISMVSPGTSYSDNPTCIISGDGIGATATATVVNGQVNSIQVTERGSDYTVASISISDSSGTGATAKVNLLGRFGSIRTYYLQDNGQKVIVDESAGTIDYESGEVVLTSLTAYEVATTPYFGLDQNVFTLNIKPKDETLFPVRNRIITIDENDLTSIDITIVEDNSTDND